MGRSDTNARICVTLAAGPGAAERLTAALGAVEVATAVVRPAAGSATLDAASALPLVTLAQARGVAVLIEADARLARTLKADGVHLPWSPDVVAAYAEAREILGKRGIVGAEAGCSRHAAMELGEAGADYVAFRRFPDSGRHPDAATDDGGGAEPAIELPCDQLSLIAWWADIFEVPVLGLDAGTQAEAEALIEAGADFVAFELKPGAAVGDIAALLQAPIAGRGSK